MCLPAKDMPFSGREGWVPDLIWNPGSLPKRMTIGHILDGLLGRAAAVCGAASGYNATPFHEHDLDAVGRMLMSKYGMHPAGEDVLYNGHTGQQIRSSIFVGMPHYMRSKHMVADKINIRSRGPRTPLTNQPTHGRKQGGGQRLGEMERDVLLAHGVAAMCRESLLDRSDGHVSITAGRGVRRTFPHVMDVHAVDGDIDPESRSTWHSRISSQSRVPTAMRVLTQELQALHIDARLCTTRTADPEQHFPDADSDAESESSQAVLHADECSDLSPS
jgi:DNA-directed RNA polymerase II subunit RPB2